MQAPDTGYDGAGKTDGLMPVYTYNCPSGHEVTRRRLYALRDRAVVCGICGSQMARNATEAFSVGHSEPVVPPSPIVPPSATGEIQRSGPIVVLKDCTFENNELGINMEGGVLAAEGTTFIGNRRGAMRTAKGAVVRMRDTKSK